MDKPLEPPEPRGFTAAEWDQIQLLMKKGATIYRAIDRLFPGMTIGNMNLMIEATGKEMVI